jgi:tetrapyrrole methylase family protein/MazG family protein
MNLYNRFIYRKGDFVSDKALESHIEEYKKLVGIVARLRGPEGCPWDKEQTHVSLREFLLEESYEVLQALDEENTDKLCQELGDLLLQILLHSQIASEKGEFQLEDVLHNISTKLVRRHPHVFGKTRVSSAEEVSHNWEDIKKTERKPGTSILESVSRTMPALAYSQEVQRRVAQVGFDWEDINGVIEKLAEEVKEYQNTTNMAEKEDEFGDIFFTLANIARRAGVDPEASLRKANQKFFLRFSRMEKLCRERGLELGKLSFQEQNALWEEAKKELEG